MLRTSSLIALALLAGQAWTAAAAETCGAPFEVAQRTFKKLEAPLSYVWVDDIPTGLFGRYSPFKISVVVGSAYAPLHGDGGKLEAKDFETLVARAYGVKRTDGDVSRQRMQKGIDVTFDSGKQRFVLRVDAVRPSLAGVDKVVLKLCQP